jgi:hypothetical protein
MKIPGLPLGPPAPANPLPSDRPVVLLPSQVVAETTRPVMPVQPVDVAAALRVLVEEIKLAAVEQLGSLRARLPEAGPGESPAEAAARALRFLKAATTEFAGSGRRVPPGFPSEALAVATDRALATLARRANALPGAALAVEEVRVEIARALATPPDPRSAPPQQAVPRLFVEQVRGALEERLGTLPAALGAIGDPEAPAESLAAINRLFKAAAADPVIAVRASGLALRQTVELGAARALSIAAGGAAPDESGPLIADLRTLSLRQLASSPARATASPADLPSDPRAVLRLVVFEVRQALAERSAAVLPPAPPLDPEGSVDALRFLGSLVREVALDAASWPPGDPRGARSSAEAVLDVAFRRALLQLPSAMTDRAQVVAGLADLRADATRLLAAAEAFAARAAVPDARGWARPAAEAATALLRGQDPPFRLDLFASGLARRRRHAGDATDGDSVEAIGTTDPDDREPEPVEWPLWPR